MLKLEICLLLKTFFKQRGKKLTKSHGWVFVRQSKQIFRQISVFITEGLRVGKIYSNKNNFWRISRYNNCMIEIYFSVILTSWGALPRRSSSIRFSIFVFPCFSVKGHQKQVWLLKRFYSVYDFKIDGCHEKKRSHLELTKFQKAKNSFTEGHLLFPPKNHFNWRDRYNFALKGAEESCVQWRVIDLSSKQINEFFQDKVNRTELSFSSYLNYNSLGLF